MTATPPVSHRLGRWLAQVATPAWDRADVAVVLGGHPRVRVPAAVDLLEAGRVGRIVVVGGQLVDGRPAEVRRGEREALARGVAPSQLESLETEALGTVEEAVVVRRAALESGWQRVVVVTSPYHCRRTGQVFGHAFADVAPEVRVVATPYDDWSEDGWHTDRRQRSLVGRELVKLVLWRTGLRRLVRPGR